MKLITYKSVHNEIEKVGILHKDEDSAESIAEFGITYNSMNELIANITKEELKVLADKVAQNDSFSLQLQDINILAPIPVPNQDIICLGINYSEHAKESARYKKEAFEANPEYPVYFSKRVNQAVANEEGIPSYEDVVDSLDYEAELAVIIGKDAKNVALGQSKEYIFGYTIINDISARNVQTRHKQWFLGKSLDGFTPMGPYIITADEIEYPPKLNIQSFVNGELRQNSNTEHMIHDIDFIIHDLSRCMTLKAGTVISTGTPAGVGMGLTPPQFLKPGDEVICKIEKLGELKNSILK